MTVAFELPGLEVSVVDHAARELLLLSASQLRAGLVLGSNPASSERRLWCCDRPEEAAIAWRLCLPT